MIGLQCSCSASVFCSNWLMKQPSLSCSFFLRCLPYLFILFSAGGHRPFLCIWVMLWSQFEEGEETDLGAGQRNVNFCNVNLQYAGVCALSFPSHSAACGVVLSIWLLFFLSKHRKYNSKLELLLSKVPHCIIHEFGKKRGLFRIPLSLLNFCRWISGLFGWLKLKFELLKQQGGSSSVFCQEGWGRQHFIFSLIKTSLQSGSRSFQLRLISREISHWSLKCRTCSPGAVFNPLHWNVSDVSNTA